MTRIKRSVHSKKKKRKYFQAAKGFRGARKNLWRTVREAVDKANLYSYRDRKVKKRDFRQLWIIRINAACRQFDVSYSVFINKLKQSSVDMDRKMLASIAYNDIEAFGQIIQQVGLQPSSKKAT